MSKLIPPDHTVFVNIESRSKGSVKAVITDVGSGVDYEVGQRVGIIGKIDNLEIQGDSRFSVHEKYIAFLYE
jgi:hypothetical protein